LNRETDEAMRTWNEYSGPLLLLVVGCSSSSPASTTPHDAATAIDVHADARHDSGPPPRKVCEPASSDAGPGDGGGDALDHDALADADHKDAAGKDGGDAGLVHCTTDMQCAPGDVCDTTMTLCVQNDGTTFCSGTADGGGAPGTCSVNAGDICCTTTMGCLVRPAMPVAGGGPCCPGPTGDTYCQGKFADDTATCGSGNVCTTCMDTCVTANPIAYERFVAHQVADCGCIADGPCYSACHDSTSTAPDSACGLCLTAQTQEGLGSTCTLAAAADCSSDPDCTAYQACAGMCPM
jgi:hypothetical protein